MWYATPCSIFFFHASIIFFKKLDHELDWRIGWKLVVFAENSLKRGCLLFLKYYSTTFIDGWCEVTEWRTLDISVFSIWKPHSKQFIFCTVSVNAIRFENEYKMIFQPLLHWWKIHRQSDSVFTLLITKSIRYLCLF